MEVIKLAPCSCTLCGSTTVFKKDKGMACKDCSKIVMPDGKTIPLDSERLGGAVDSSFEMGDRIEGTIGVHAYNGNFCNGIK